MMKSNPAVANGRPKAPRATGASNTAPTPKEIWGMLRRHLWLIFFMIVLGAMTGAGGWYLIRRFFPLYRAEAILRVLPPVETDPMEIVATQVQQDIQYGHRVSLANLMKSQAMLQRLLDPVLGRKVRETQWFRDTVHEDIADALKYLERDLSIVPQREADQITIAMTCAKAKEAALIATQMAELFVNQHGETKRDEVSAKLVDLTQQESVLEKDIRDREGALQALREAAGEKGITNLQVPDGRYFQHTITLRLNELETQESELELAVKQLQADIGNLEQLAEGPINEQVEHAIEGDPVMVVLAQQLAMLEGQLSGRLTKFGEDHPIVRQTRQLIDEVQAKRQQRRMEIGEQTRRANLYNARDSLRVLEERLAELQQLRDKAMDQQKALDQARAEYDQIEKTRDERIETLNQIKTQIEKLRIMIKDPDTPKVQLIGPAPEPFEMVISRHILLWIPGGTMLGLTFGLMIALLAEMLNDLVRTPSDVRRFLHLPLLGVIPDASEDRAVDDIDLYHIVHEAPYSLLGEAYRRCRTNLDVSDQAAFKTLLIASGDAGDGKTSVACNLAAAFVAKYEKVLLIDANLRQPSLHLAFGRSSSDDGGKARRMGLTSILTGQCDHLAAIHASRVTGLDIIYAGPPTTNPAELLASRRMKNLIESVSVSYDRVIIDSPPVLLVSDVKVLARLVDATLLVFSAATTRRGAARRTIFELQDVGAKTIGCVLFGAEAMKGGYFSQQFRAYRKYLKPQLAASSA
jgi:succinoglycan biosynthesis transport protein ExoP